MGRSRHPARNHRPSADAPRNAGAVVGDARALVGRGGTHGPSRRPGLREDVRRARARRAHQPGRWPTRGAVPARRLARLVGRAGGFVDRALARRSADAELPQARTLRRAGHRVPRAARSRAGRTRRGPRARSRQVPRRDRGLRRPVIAVQGIHRHLSPARVPRTRAEVGRSRSERGADGPGCYADRRGASDIGDGARAMEAGDRRRRSRRRVARRTPAQSASTGGRGRGVRAPRSARAARARKQTRCPRSAVGSAAGVEPIVQWFELRRCAPLAGLPCSQPPVP